MDIHPLSISAHNSAGGMDIVCPVF
jgi:hypothetical protein